MIRKIRSVLVAMAFALVAFLGTETVVSAAEHPFEVGETGYTFVLCSDVDMYRQVARLQAANNVAGYDAILSDPNAECYDIRRGHYVNRSFDKVPFEVLEALDTVKGEDGYYLLFKVRDTRAGGEDWYTGQWFPSGTHEA